MGVDAESKIGVEINTASSSQLIKNNLNQYQTHLFKLFLTFLIMLASKITDNLQGLHHNNIFN